MWYLFLLVAAGLVAVLIWDYRRRAAAREAASKARFEQIFNAKAAAPSPEPPAAAAPATGPGVVARKAPAAAATFSARERFLGQPETLIYRLLRAGIPDHEIFANVSLASVVVTPGAGLEHEQQVRRLSQYQLDFVVCDKSMRIVSAVEIEGAAGTHAAGEQRFMAESLKAAGVNLVRINPAALPRREAIRALVCGQPNAAGS